MIPAHPAALHPDPLGSLPPTTPLMRQISRPLGTALSETIWQGALSFIDLKRPEVTDADHVKSGLKAYYPLGSLPESVWPLVRPIHSCFPLYLCLVSRIALDLSAWIEPLSEWRQPYTTTLAYSSTQQVSASPQSDHPLPALCHRIYRDLKKSLFTGIQLAQKSPSIALPFSR